MYEVIFWIWFVGACGCFAYDIVWIDGDVDRDDVVEASMSATIWPIALVGTAIAAVYVLGRRFIWNCRFL